MKMQRRKEKLIRNNNRYEVLNHNEEKKKEGRIIKKYINLSYHVRKLFSYCDADILRIENNLLIYNCIIESIKKNGNKLVKSEVEKIVREKTENPDYCLEEMEAKEYKISDFDLQKVELDFQFIECSLCFELIKFVCIQECNHMFCFLCFQRLVNMGKKEQEQTEGTEENRMNNGEAYNGITGNAGNGLGVSNRNNNGHRSRNRHHHQNHRHRNDRNDRNDRYGNSTNGNGLERFSLSFVDYIEPKDKVSQLSSIGEEEKECCEFVDKEKLKVNCPFCKEPNEYMFICLNNFYTYFTYKNLLNTLLTKENNKGLIEIDDEFVELNEEYLKKKWLEEWGKKGHVSIALKEEIENEKVKDSSEIKPKLGANGYFGAKSFREEGNIEQIKKEEKKEKEENKETEEKKEKEEKEEKKETEEKKEKEEKEENMVQSKMCDLRKQCFYSYYDDILVLHNMLRKRSGSSKPNVAKTKENMYLFFYYEKYIKWKKKRIKYILDCIYTKKKYAFFCKIFVDTSRSIVYEYFYIFSLSTVLTNYVCLLSPCRDYWTTLQSKKIEKYKSNSKADNYFISIYVKNDKSILRKKNDSIYDRYQQHTKILGEISEEESEQSDEFFKVVDIFCKACFTNLDNVNFLVYLKYYSFQKLFELNKHLGEHRKIYCDICAGNNNNMFLFEYNILHRRYLKHHVDEGDGEPSNQYNVRHIFCHLCNMYLYDFESYQNHVNKYHFHCKFCFNKPLDQQAELETGEAVDGKVYYDTIYTHVYKDYTSLFDHYKRKHYPCLYEQCIFVVYDNNIDLCIHLAKKHDEKDYSKRNKITLSIGGSSYNDVRNNVQSSNNNFRDASSNREDWDMMDENEWKMNKYDEATSSKEKLDIKNLKCIYNFSKYDDVWYFDYFVPCKVKSFITYFEEHNKGYFLYVMKTDMELILKVFEDLSVSNPDVYYSQEEIIELNKHILSSDFANNKKNNFFVFRMFFDYVVETIEYLLYHKEDLEKDFLYLFFNIVVKKSFIFYYALSFLYLNKKHVDLQNWKSAVCVKKGKSDAQKVKPHYKYDEETMKLRKRLEMHTSVNFQNLSRYGFLYLIFLFLKMDKYGFEKAGSFLKTIVSFCRETYDNISSMEEREEKEHGQIYISLNLNKNDKKYKDKEKNMLNYPSIAFNDVKSSSIGSIELENLEELISANIKKNRMNNNIINNICNAKLHISKKVTLDLIYYIQSDLNLTSFFYIFLNNYFSVDMRDKNANVISKISIENQNKIKKKIGADVDLTSLTTISRDLGGCVNAQTLEECLSTGAEYYRIRKDVQNILQEKNSSPKKADRQEKGKAGNTVNNTAGVGGAKKSNLNIYEISFSLRNRFPNIVKSTKTMELLFIYYYIHSITTFTNGSSKREIAEEEYPSLNYENGEMGVNSLSYKSKLEMKAEHNALGNVEEFPSLTETKKEGRGGGSNKGRLNTPSNKDEKKDTSNSNSNKKKNNKDLKEVDKNKNHVNKNTRDTLLNVSDNRKPGAYADAFKNLITEYHKTSSPLNSNNVERNIHTLQNIGKNNSNNTSSNIGVKNEKNKGFMDLKKEEDFPPIFLNVSQETAKIKTNNVGKALGEKLNKLSEFPALNALDNNEKNEVHNKGKNKGPKGNKINDGPMNNSTNKPGSMFDAINLLSGVQETVNKEGGISGTGKNLRDNSSSKRKKNSDNNKGKGQLNNDGVEGLMNNGGRTKNNETQFMKNNMQAKENNGGYGNEKDRKKVCGRCAYENTKNRETCELCEHKL